MRATDLLRQQHLEIHALLRQLAEAPVSDRAWFRGRLSTALRGHTTIEEEVFYPPLEDIDELEDLIADRFREHEELKEALADLERCAEDDREFPELVDRLEELVQHHVDGEESQLLARVETLWTDEHLAKIGSHMGARYRELAEGPPARV